MTQLTEREAILSALDGFMSQTPGLEFANYGDVSAYRSESRAITKDLHHGRRLLAAVSWRSSITADDLKEAFRAFSGRLTWDGHRLDYCTGQYFPTEFRKGVCAVLASALWSYTRDCMPEPTAWGVSHIDESGFYDRNNERTYTAEAEAKHYADSLPDAAHPIVGELYDGKSAGDWIRGKLRKEYGHAISSRYFN